MLPASLQDPTMLTEVSGSTWRKVFDAAGETQRLAATNFKSADIHASFESQPPGTELFNALELIYELGTDDGRIHTEQVAQDQPVKLPISPDATAAREFVAQLWIISKSDPAIAELLLRAQLTQRPPESSRTYREFVGAGNAPKIAIDNDKLKSSISDWCRASGKSDVISIITREYNGEWYGHVLRGDPPKRVPEIRRQRLNVLEYQPAATDLLRYDPKTGRMGIATRSPQLLKAYRESMGTLLAANDQFFAGENVCSLLPLQLQGNALFEANHVLGINCVDVVNLLWRRGDHDKVWVSGRDCFRILKDLGARLLEGELIEARLKVHFSDGGRPGNVTLKAPNIIEIKAPKPDLVEQLLDTAGLRGSFKDDGTPKNFWGDYPWRIKEAEWRRRLGDDFDRVLKSGLLRHVTLDTVEHPDHPHAGRALEVEDIAPGVAIGVSSDPAIGVRTVTISDVEGYQLQIPAVAQAIKATMGLDGACVEIALNSGVWSLGTRSFGPGLALAAFLVTREPGAATAAQILTAAGGATPLALYPLNCKAIDGVASTPCRLPQGPHDSLLEDAVHCLKWHGQISPTIWSSAELIVDVPNGVMFFKRVPINAGPDTRAFKFGMALAKARGNIVTDESLSQKLSAGRLDPKNLAKDAKRDFLNSIRVSFEGAGKEQLKDVIVERAGCGYRLVRTAKVCP